MLLSGKAYVFIVLLCHTFVPRVHNFIRRGKSRHKFDLFFLFLHWLSANIQGKSRGKLALFFCFVLAGADIFGVFCEYHTHVILLLKR